MQYVELLRFCYIEVILDDCVFFWEDHTLHPYSDKVTTPYVPVCGPPQSRQDIG